MEEIEHDKSYHSDQDSEKQLRRKNRKERKRGAKLEEKRNRIVEERRERRENRFAGKDVNMPVFGGINVMQTKSVAAEEAKKLLQQQRE